MCGVRVAPNSLRVQSRGMRVAPGSPRHRQLVWLTLTVEAVDVGRLVKVAGCGLFPLVGEGQSIDDGCLCRDLRDSVMGGPTGYVSGLVFAPTSSPMVKFC